MDPNKLLVIAFVLMAVGIIPVLIGFLRNANRPFFLTLTWLLAIVSLACDMGQMIFVYSFGRYFGTVYQLLEFELLLWIYSRILSRKNWNNLFYILGGSFLLFFLFDVSVFEPGGFTATYSATVSAFVFIVMSLTCFYDLMRDPPEERLSQLPVFWVNLGVLIFFAGNLFVFALAHYIAVSLKGNSMLFWTFHNFLDQTKNILFAVALWPRTTKPRLP